MYLIDSHCHLDFPELQQDIDGVMERAKAAGVQYMLTICTNLSEEPKIRKLAQQHPSVFYAAANHPLYVQKTKLASLDDLLSISKHKKFIAIGETGLDNHYSREHYSLQRQSLDIHIEAARQSGLPLIIHSRDADEEMENALRNGLAGGRFSCVMHCYSSGTRLAEFALSEGFYMSMSGIITFAKSESLRDIFRAAPVEKILVETDAPYLAPVPKRGRRNEPAFVAHVAAKGAELFDMDVGDFAKTTSKNFFRLFAKAQKWTEE